MCGGAAMKRQSGAVGVPDAVAGLAQLRASQALAPRNSLARYVSLFDADEVSGTGSFNAELLLMSELIDYERTVTEHLLDATVVCTPLANNAPDAMAQPSTRWSAALVGGFKRV